MAKVQELKIIFGEVKDRSLGQGLADRKQLVHRGGVKETAILVKVLHLLGVEDAVERRRGRWVHNDVGQVPWGEFAKILKTQANSNVGGGAFQGIVVGHATLFWRNNNNVAQRKQSSEQ